MDGVLPAAEAVTGHCSLINLVLHRLCACDTLKFESPSKCSKPHELQANVGFDVISDMLMTI